MGEKRLELKISQKLLVRTGRARKIVYELQEVNLFILGILQLMEKGRVLGMKVSTG